MADLPNLIVIGAQKCATTSLHHYLDLHPQIAMSKRKELDFFVAARNWRRGLSWYRSQFTEHRDVMGESSPNYTNYPVHAGVPERIAKIIPKAKLIYVLRDPIERIVSQYVHLYAGHMEHRPFAQALAAPKGRLYLHRSRYFTQLQRFLDCFEQSQILIVTAEELARDRAGTLAQCFRFLGVDEKFTSPKFSGVRHQSRYKRRKTPLGRRIERLIGDHTRGWLRTGVGWHAKRLLYLPFSTPVPRPAVTDDVRARLTDALKPDIDRLRAHTGRTFEHWSI
jgi:hypothetical protein